MDVNYLIEVDPLQSGTTRSQLIKIVQYLQWTSSLGQLQPHTYTRAASCQGSATHTVLQQLVAQYSLDAASPSSSLAHAYRPREAGQSPLQALTATTAWLEAGNTLSGLRPVHVGKMGEARRHCGGCIPWEVLVMKVKPPARAHFLASIRPISFSATEIGMSTFLSCDGPTYTNHLFYCRRATQER